MYSSKKILSYLVNLVFLLRPKQWIKNVFLFFPSLFAGTLFVGENFLDLFFYFSLFSLFSGATYIYNDILDREKDRLHPKKKKRPIASGAISIRVGYMLMFSIFIGVFSFLLFEDRVIGILFIAYLLYSGLYSTILKKIPFLDIISLSVGFLLRVGIGAFVVGVDPSLWLLAVVFFSSVWFGASKRYQEISLGKESRPVLRYYSHRSLKTLLLLLTIILLSLYASYVYSERPLLPFFLSIPVFSFGILRYFYMVEYSQDRTQSIEDILFSDTPLLISGSLFLFLILFSFL